MEIWLQERSAYKESPKSERCNRAQNHNGVSPKKIYKKKSFWVTLVINLFVIPAPEDKRMELYMREVKTKTDDLPMDVAVPTKPVSASHPTRLCCAVDNAARSFGRPAATCIATRPQDCDDANPNICWISQPAICAWRHVQGEKRCDRLCIWPTSIDLQFAWLRNLISIFLFHDWSRTADRKAYISS